MNPTTAMKMKIHPNVAATVRFGFGAGDVVGGELGA
jgi:hypothetical protein